MKVIVSNTQIQNVTPEYLDLYIAALPTAMTKEMEEGFRSGKQMLMIQTSNDTGQIQTSRVHLVEVEEAKPVGEKLKEEAEKHVAKEDIGTTRGNKRRANKAP
jgi:hypothetical protein